jgi:hypothetical protein
MNRWLDTSTLSEDEETFSEEAIDYVDVIESFDLGVDEGTGSEVSENENWEKVQTLEPKSPIISVFDVATIRSVDICAPPSVE